MTIFLELALFAMITVLSSVIFYTLEKKTAFGNIPYMAKQVIIGIVFGGIAILGTEYGVDVGGAAANARDSAPLCAGLIFGGPAGIIAGIIGGVERWYAVYWGVGEYSRVACSVSTILAGIYAAYLRKYMFDDKKPSWAIGFAAAVVMEVLHLTILFMTHLSDSENAFTIVKIVTEPMILVNAFAVSVSIFITNLIHKEKRKKANYKRSISRIVQIRMFVCVLLAFFATTYFVFEIQSGVSESRAKEELMLGIEDIDAQIEANPNWISGIAKHRHIGKSGYMVLVDARNKIVSAPTDVIGQDFVRSEYYSTTLNRFEENIVFETTISGKKVFTAYRKIDGFTAYAFLPDEEVYYERDALQYVNSFMEVLVFAVLFALIYMLIKKLVLTGLKNVNSSLSQITSGNLDVVVNVRNSREFQNLSDDINATVDTLKRYIKEAEERIDKELELAKQIQTSSLPRVFPPFPEEKRFDIFASMRTAKEVGGDFYDFFYIGENKLAFLIADVSGKGIPAAMFMMKAKSIIKSYAETGVMANEVLQKTNNELCKNNDAGMFVTAWLGIIDLSTGNVTYASAGHNPPIVASKEMPKFLSSKSGLVLAGIEDITYNLGEYKLEKGDKIYLYTDGITEANNERDELFGEDRLLKSINDNASSDVKTLCEKVLKDTDKFVGTREQFDDMTMLCIRYNGE